MNIVSKGDRCWTTDRRMNAVIAYIKQKGTRLVLKLWGKCLFILANMFDILAFRVGLRKQMYTVAPSEL